MNKILVAVDLGRSTGRVFEAVIGLALRTGAEVETIFVVPDPLAHDTEHVLESVLKFDEREILDRARDRVEAMFDRALKDLDVPFAHRDQIGEIMRKRTVVIGDPARSIVDHAARIGADLVVVGSQDSTRRDTTRLGSVAWAVLRRCPTHLMVVPVSPMLGMTEEGR